MVLQIVFGLPDLTISHIDSNEHKIDEEINNSNFYFLLLLIRFFLKFIEKKKKFIEFSPTLSAHMRTIVLELEGGGCRGRGHVLLMPSSQDALIIFACNFAGRLWAY